MVEQGVVLGALFACLFIGCVVAIVFFIAVYCGSLVLNSNEDEEDSSGHENPESSVLGPNSPVPRPIHAWEASNLSNGTRFLNQTKPGVLTRKLAWIPSPRDTPKKPEGISEDVTDEDMLQVKYRTNYILLTEKRTRILNGK